MLVHIPRQCSDSVQQRFVNLPLRPILFTLMKTKDRGTLNSNFNVLQFLSKIQKQMFRNINIIYMMLFLPRFQKM